MKTTKPIVTVSHDRKLIFTTYGNKTTIERAPHGSAYAAYQTANLPVRPAPKRPQLAPPPAPRQPTARQSLRQSLGLDTIRSK
ncbi:MAG: hypothetical protein ABIR70_13465 [Bryobacteraceae bacterium]